jgi:hypothetical protein
MIERVVGCTANLKMEYSGRSSRYIGREKNGVKIDVAPRGNLAFEETIVAWLAVEASGMCREVTGETCVKNIMRL